MSAAATLWVVIVGVGALNYLSRLSFIAVFARWSMPPLVARALRFVPAAMLTAIVVPGVALQAPAGADPALAPAKLAAAAIAGLVAWRSRNIPATVACGMLALWGAQWLLRAIL